MGKLLLVGVVALLAVLSLRLRSQYQLEERLTAYHVALRTRALASLPGVDSVPSEELIRERAQALAQELGLEVRALEARVTRDAAPSGGVAGMLADKLGALPGLANADAQGNVEVGGERGLRTNIVEVSAQVHADGFLCSVDQTVSASANIGYAIAP